MYGTDQQCERIFAQLLELDGQRVRLVGFNGHKKSGVAGKRMCGDQAIPTVDGWMKMGELAYVERVEVMQANGRYA